MHSAVSPIVPSVLPKKYLENVKEEQSDEEKEFFPLPDVVPCAALSASNVHGERIRERRRHKATIQTKGREHLELLNLEDMMEPLERGFKGLFQNTVSMNPEPIGADNSHQVDRVYQTQRQRTISSTSSTATAKKLSTLSAVVVSAQMIKKDALTIEDTPEGVFNGLKNIFNNVFAN